MQADHGVGLRARAMTGSQYSDEDRREADAVRTLGHAHGHEAALGVAADLGRGLLGVGEVGDAERDEPVGVLLPPLLVHPVVVRTRAPRSRARGPGALEYTRPQKPVIIDGKLSDAQIAAVSMSTTRACGS